MKQNISKFFAALFTLLFILLISIPLSHFIFTPSNDKNWTPDQQILADLEFATNTVKIANIKNFSYGETEKDQTPGYKSEIYKLDSVKDVWYFQNDFKEPLGAHSFLTFEFDDGRFLSASVEIRKEVGESYDPIYALWPKYELHYMIVTEDDILTLRAAKRAEPVFMYKLKLTRSEKNSLLLEWLKHADNLNKNPEFYNTLTNACTTNITYRLQAILPRETRLKVTKDIVFPKSSDEYFYEIGLINTGLTFEEIKSSSKINQKVLDAIKQKLPISTFIRQNYSVLGKS